MVLQRVTCISDPVLLQLREAYVFLMDKDGRCEILFPIQFGKTVIDIAMEWVGGPEGRSSRLCKDGGLSGLGFQGGIGVLQIEEGKA